MFLIQSKRNGKNLYVVTASEAVVTYGTKAKAARLTNDQARLTCQFCNENTATHHQVIEEGEAR